MIGKNVRFASAIAVLAAAATLGIPRTAHAQDAGPPLCTSFSTGNLVYVSGSTAVRPALQKLAPTLAALNIGIVYQGPGSCTGLNNVLVPMKDTSGAQFLPADGSPGKTCVLTDTVNGQPVDLAVSDVFPAICTQNFQTPALTSGFKEFLGPIQVMTMVTRKDSTESSISADAAYTIFGFEGQASLQVAPWTDPTQMFIRNSNSGTLNMIATAIGLAPAKWLPHYTVAPQRQPNSGGVLNAIQNATNVNASIGIVAADYADQFRNPPAPDGGTAPPGLKILAYKHAGQSCGYLPDSDSTHFDKINVRQGRYAIWGPVHFVTAVDASGNPKNPSVATVLQYITSVGQNPDQTLTATQKKQVIDADAFAFTIPWCAMQVQRSSEIATPAPFQPTEPCGCYYESIEHSMVSTCTACADDTACSGSTPTCRYGFCEAR